MLDQARTVRHASRIARRLRVIRLGHDYAPLARLDAVMAIAEPRARLLALADLHDEVEPLVRARLGDGASYGLLVPSLVEQWRQEAQHGSA